MTRLLLRALNAPALVLLTLMGLAIQTSFFSFWIFKYLQPDLTLLVVIWFALRRKFTEGGILTLILANVAELHSSSPSGVFLISYMTVYLLVRAGDRLLVLPETSSFFTATLVLTAVAKAVDLIVLKLLGVHQSLWQNGILDLIPEALVNALLGQWLFSWLAKFDWVTYKTPQAERALDDELQLENPGI